MQINDGRKMIRVKDLEISWGDEKYVDKRIATIKEIKVDTPSVGGSINWLLCEAEKHGFNDIEAWLDYEFAKVEKL